MKDNRGLSPVVLETKKLWIIAGSVAVLAYWSLNLSGFCFSQLRYLSDEQKIRMAIERLTSVNPSPELRPRTRGVVLSDKKYSHYRQVLRTYDSVEDFMQKNPNCCALVPKQESFSEDFIYPTFWDKITGAYNYGIRYRYTWSALITPIDENGNEGVPFVKEMKSTYGIEFGNCGCAWEKTHD